MTSIYEQFTPLEWVYPRTNNLSQLEYYLIAKQKAGER
jgi:hypothetical protein